MVSTPNSSEEPSINWLEMSVSGLLEYQAAILKDQIAIETEDGSITYNELNRRSNGLAQLLREYSGEYAVVLATDFIEHVVGQFAALKAGKTVVLLDPYLPAEMLVSMLDSIPCRLIITSSKDIKLVELVQATSEEGFQIVYSNTSGFMADSPDINYPMDKAAFIMFTSGSTGEPKGVIKSHQFIMHDLMIRAEKYQMTIKDRVMLTGDLFFGRTLFTALSTLFGGATMVVSDMRKWGIDVLPQWLNERGITIFSPTGSMQRGLNAILSGTERFPRLRIIRIGAEAVNGRDLEMIKKCISDDCLIWINYGSTETGSICCNIFTKDRSIPQDVLSVGRSFTGKQIQIVDKDGNELPVGVSGHVLVVSKYLSSGYLHVNESDQDKYIFCKGSDGAMQTIYRTGDIGTLQPPGMLELEGRADQMVKIRGYRVDLSFVEMQMNQLEEVVEAVVVVQDSALAKRLVGYVVLKNSLDTSELKALLSQRLAAYMIPSRIEVIESLPKLSNGKIDRRALSELNSSQDSETKSQEKDDQDIESFVKALWVKALGHEDFSDEDSFFDMGGDSISAAVMISDIEKHFQMNVSSVVFWQDPTIRGISESIGFHIQKGIEHRHNGDIRKTSRSRERLINYLITELRKPEGRTKLLRQRRFIPRLRLWRSRFDHKTQDKIELLDWVQVKLIKLILAGFSYSRAVILLKKMMTLGLSGIMIPKKKRQLIKDFNLKINPHLSKAQLHKGYLFYTLLEYDIINRAVNSYKSGKLDQVRVSVVGKEVLDQAIENGTGVLLVGSHSSANLWVKCLDLEIYTLGAVYGILKSYRLERYETAVYASLIREASQRLRNGGIVKIVADGKEGSGATHSYSIAGFDKTFFTGFAEIALQTGATIIPITSYMTDPFNVTIHFNNPLTIADQGGDHSKMVQKLTESYANILKDQIVTYPWQMKIDHIYTPQKK